MYCYLDPAVFRTKGRAERADSTTVLHNAFYGYVANFRFAVFLCMYCGESSPIISYVVTAV